MSSSTCSPQWSINDLEVLDGLGINTRGWEHLGVELPNLKQVQLNEDRSIRMAAFERLLPVEEIRALEPRYVRSVDTHDFGKLRRRPPDGRLPPRNRPGSSARGATPWLASCRSALRPPR